MAGERRTACKLQKSVVAGEHLVSGPVYQGVTATETTTRTVPSALVARTTYENAGWSVRFVKLPSTVSVPGYTHRVVVAYEGTQVAVDWLSHNCKPSAKAALYYVQKHADTTAK